MVVVKTNFKVSSYNFYFVLMKKVRKLGIPPLHRKFDVDIVTSKKI